LTLQELLHQLSDIPNQLFNLPPPLQLPSSQQLPCIADASHHFNLQAPILQTMDLELESVQNHLDQLSTAAKADDFDEEEFQGQPCLLPTLNSDDKLVRLLRGG
jgi:hypothetical protein